MGVSSLIDLEQTQEENQRKRGNSEAGLLSDVLFTPAALIFLNPKDSPWAAAPGQDTGTAHSPTDTWSGHRDSPQPYRHLVRTQGQPAALQTCLFTHLAPWPRVPAGVGEQPRHRTGQAGWPLSSAPRGGPRRAGLGPCHPLLVLGHRCQPLSTSGMRDGEGISF